MTASETLAALSEAFLRFRHRTEPSWAHMLGDYSHAGSFEDLSRAAEDDGAAEALRFAQQAEAIGSEELSEQEQLTREILQWSATATAERASLRLTEFTLDPISGIQQFPKLYTAQFTLPTAEVAAAMPGKVSGCAKAVADTVDRLREGLSAGRTPVAFAAAGVIAQLDAWLATPLDSDPLLNLAATPEGVDRQALLDQVREVVRTEVRPAVGELRRLVVDELQAAARPDERAGLAHVPGGADAYATLVQHFTTTDLTPERIHEIGLEQVAKLELEYANLGAQVLGTSDVPEVLARLRDDPSLHYASADDAAAAARAALAKAKAAMGDYFGRLPKADCTIEAVIVGPKAYYLPPAADGSRGGGYFFNVANPAAWGTFELEAVSYHEAIPGHHLQIAIATELDDVPQFRRELMEVASYIEGWGLYTERLADEMGLYSTPLDRMGMLSADSMRACRLVVDTGLHALGWSRQQAIDYMAANSPLHHEHVVNEIDRYICSPGQAVSYMIGRLEILRIRAAAKARQGEAFSLPAFHDAVLDSGAMPLGVLARHVATRLP